MEHVVFFSESSGDPAFRRVADLAEAVRLVESLRNEQGITDVAVHALTPVPVSFRTYYRVEVAAGPQGPSADSVLSAEPVPSVQPAEPVAALQPAEPAEPGPSLDLAPVDLAPADVVDEGPALHLLPPPAVEEAAPEQFEAEIEQSSFADFAVESGTEDEAVAESEVAEFPLAEFEVAEFPVAEFPVAGFEVSEFEVADFEVATAEEPAEALAEFGSYEPLVPQVRSEPEVEHSLGYFAR
jgi:hypothetical protein